MVYDFPREPFWHGWIHDHGFGFVDYLLQFSLRNFSDRLDLSRKLLISGSLIFPLRIPEVYLPSGISRQHDQANGTIKASLHMIWSWQYVKLTSEEAMLNIKHGFIGQKTACDALLSCSENLIVVTEPNNGQFLTSRQAKNQSNGSFALLSSRKVSWRQEEI